LQKEQQSVERRDRQRQPKQHAEVTTKMDMIIIRRSGCDYATMRYAEGPLLHWLCHLAIGSQGAQLPVAKLGGAGMVELHYKTATR